jgi:hypothetical protein
MLQEGGADPRRNSIIAAMTSWQTIILLISKALCHWLFGLAINVSWGLGVNMYPPQICYLTGFTFLVAIFATYVAFRRPKGCLPATYGHLQTMADIVDEFVLKYFFITFHIYIYIYIFFFFYRARF